MSCIHINTATGNNPSSKLCESLDVAKKTYATKSLTSIVYELPSDASTLTAASDLDHLFNLLNEGGTLEIVLSNSSAKLISSDDLVLAGFIDVEKKEGANSETSVTKISGKKPEWKTGASKKLKSKKIKVQHNAESVWASLSTSNEMKLPGGNTDEQDQLLMDEDSLLESAASIPTAKAKGQQRTDNTEGGCATKRRACANCSCGRKEREEAEENGTKVTVDTEDKPAESACGSCYKGDAFRCATCPYRGMAPFKPGEKPKLLETKAKEGTGTVVKLDLGGDDIEF
eukprot:g1064.t1